MIPGGASARAILFQQPQQLSHAGVSRNTPVSGGYKAIEPESDLLQNSKTGEYYKNLAELNSFAEAMYSNYGLDITRPDPSDPNSVEANDIYLRMLANVRHAGDKLKYGQKTARTQLDAYNSGKIAPVAGGVESFIEGDGDIAGAFQNFTALSQDPMTQNAFKVATEEYDDPNAYNVALQDTNKAKEALAILRDRAANAGDKGTAQHYQNQIDSIPTPALRENWKKKVAYEQLALERDRNNIARQKAEKSQKPLFGDENLDNDVSHLITGNKNQNVTWKVIGSREGGSKIANDPKFTATSSLGMNEQDVIEMGLDKAKKVRRSDYAQGQVFSKSPDQDKNAKPDIIDFFYEFEMPDGEKKLFVKYKAKNARGVRAEEITSGYDLQRGLIGGNPGKYSVKVEQQEEFIKSRGGFGQDFRYIPTVEPKTKKATSASPTKHTISIGGQNFSTSLEMDEIKKIAKEIKASNPGISKEEFDKQLAQRIK